MSLTESLLWLSGSLWGLSLGLNLWILWRLRQYHRTLRAYHTALDARAAAFPPLEQLVPEPPETETFVAEYDENSIVWLINLETKARLPVEHGALLVLAQVLEPGTGFA